MEQLFRITDPSEIKIGDRVKYEKWFYNLIEEVYGEVVEIKAGLLDQNLKQTYKVKVKVTERYNPQGGRKRLPIKKTTAWYQLDSLRRPVGSNY